MSRGVDLSISTCRVCAAWEPICLDLDLAHLVA